MMSPLQQVQVMSNAMNDLTTTITTTTTNNDNNTNNSRYLLPLGFQPTEDDIKIGRGKKIVAHNAKFYKIIQGELEEYKSAGSKALKSNILVRVLKHIKEVVKGKFVKEDTTNGRWYSVEDSLARTTIAQAFRDSLHTSYRSSKQFKQRRRQQAKVVVDASSPASKNLNNSPPDARCLSSFSASSKSSNKKNKKNASASSDASMMMLLQDDEPQQITLFDCARFAQGPTSLTASLSMSSVSGGEGPTGTSTTTNNKPFFSSNLQDILKNAVDVCYEEEGLFFDETANHHQDQDVKCWQPTTLLPTGAAGTTTSTTTDDDLMTQMESLDIDEAAFSPSEIAGACDEGFFVSSSLFEDHHQQQHHDHQDLLFEPTPLQRDLGNVSSFEPTPLLREQQQHDDTLDELDLAGLF